MEIFIMLHPIPPIYASSRKGFKLALCCAGEIGEHPVGIPNNLMPYIQQVGLVVTNELACQLFAPVVALHWMLDEKQLKWVLACD